MRTPPHTPPSTPPSSSSSSATRPGPACAACKHQRRRCSADCPLAPYFPADKQREFHNVHRLFGINNVVKLLKNTPPEHRDDAVTSLVHEAHFRASDPVGGAYAVVRELLRRLELCRAELSLLSDQLALHRRDGDVEDLEPAEEDRPVVEGKVDSPDRGEYSGHGRDGGGNDRYED